MSSIIEFIKKLYEALLELIYPEHGICFICDQYDEQIEDAHICTECREKLVFINDHKCKICGKPLEIGYVPDKCPECINNKHYFTKAISPLEYTGFIKDVIYKYKYSKKPYMYKLLGSLMVQAFLDNNIKNIDLIVPVPLHRSKMLERGFNQAELLGVYISKKFNIPIDSKNLCRIRKTEIQNKLKKQERHKNVKNAFKIKKDDIFKGKRILLVDDIMTTGATVDECSRVLLRAGAKEVVVITVATGRQKNN